MSYDQDSKIIKNLLKIGKPISEFTRHFILYSKHHYKRGLYDCGDGTLKPNFYRDLFVIVSKVSNTELIKVRDSDVDQLVIKAFIETAENPFQIESTMYSITKASDPVAMIYIILSQLSILRVLNDDGLPILVMGEPDSSILPLEEPLIRRPI